MEKKKGRKRETTTPLEWKRLETGNRITPGVSYETDPRGLLQKSVRGNNSEEVDEREREKGRRLEKPVETKQLWSNRDEIYAKEGRKERFFFSFFLFRAQEWSSFQRGKQHHHERRLVANGQFAIGFAVQFALHYERLDSSKRSARIPERLFFRKSVRGGGASRRWRQLASPSGAPSRLLPVSRR